MIGVHSTTFNYCSCVRAVLCESIFPWHTLMSISPKDWGPHFWHVIHCIAFWYPVEPEESDVAAAMSFYTSIGNLLPCAYCRKHYAQNLVDMPIRANSRSELLAWTVNLHNKVNAATGRPQLEMDRAILQIQRDAESPPQQSRSTTISNTTVFIGAAALVIGVLIGAAIASSSASSSASKKSASESPESAPAD